MEVEATERKEMNKERIEILTQLIPAEVDIIARATNDPGFGWMFVKSCLDLRKPLPHQVSEPQLVRPYLYVRDQNGDRDAREALIIEQVIANDEVVYGDGAVHGNPKSEIRNPNLHLPPGHARVLEIHYTANSFVAPERVLFEYKLDGYDKDWQRDNENKRVAFYTNLRGPVGFLLKQCARVTSLRKFGVDEACPLENHVYWLAYIPIDLFSNISYAHDLQSTTRPLCRLHTHRAAGGNRDHCDPRWHAASRIEQGQKQGSRHPLPEQRQTIDAGMGALFWR